MEVEFLFGSGIHFVLEAEFVLEMEWKWNLKNSLRIKFFSVNGLRRMEANKCFFL